MLDALASISLEMVIFTVLATVGIGGSLSVVLSKNPVTSALNLVLVFFSFAGLYALLEAHLLAALQIFVYAGAIMVLFVFVIMLLNADVPSMDRNRSALWLRVLVPFSCLALVGQFVYAFFMTPIIPPVGPYTAAAIDAYGGNTRVLSEVLFSEYVLPLELTSILLLSAIVGAVVMAKRQLSPQVKLS